MAKPSPHEFEVPIRLVLVRPPQGVEFCLQRKTDEKLQHTRSDGDDITFELSVRVAQISPPRFLGPFTQGPVHQRFVYVCCGTSAGQFESPWTRRAKIQLGGITPELLEQARAHPGSWLEARYEGTAKDGSPSCATVPLLDGGWKFRT